ncbi:cadherin-like domain-containing protein, partial [Mycobacterium tuberculosis]
GAASITYTITDATGKTATATALINIAAVNDAPVLAAQNFVLAPGTAKVFSPAEVLQGAYDIEGDAFKVVGVTNAVGGSVRLLADGTIRFVPKAG